jgi:competence protein ComEA
MLVIGSALGLSTLMGAWSWKPDPPEMLLPTLELDANSVPPEVLMTLPGLGPALSARIVEARPYLSIDDLDRRVRGIGPATVARIKPFLRFEPSPDSLP